MPDFYNKMSNEIGSMADWMEAPMDSTDSSTLPIVGDAVAAPVEPPSHAADAEHAPPVVMLSDTNNTSPSKSGYILYSAETRSRVMAGNPEHGFGDISRLVGEKWAALSDEEKKVYDERAVGQSRDVGGDDLLDEATDESMEDVAESSTATITEEQPSATPTDNGGSMRQSESTSSLASLPREVAQLVSNYHPQLAATTKNRQCVVDQARKEKERKREELERDREKRTRERKAGRPSKPMPADRLQASHNSDGHLVLHEERSHTYDLCDCLRVSCDGCFMPCARCSGEKCSFACRNNRTEVIDHIVMNDKKQVNIYLHRGSRPTELVDTDDETEDFTETD